MQDAETTCCCFWFFHPSQMATLAMQSARSCKAMRQVLKLQLSSGIIYFRHLSLHITSSRLTSSQSLALCTPLPWSPPPQASLTGQRRRAANRVQIWNTTSDTWLMRIIGCYGMCAWCASTYVDCVVSLQKMDVFWRRAWYRRKPDLNHPEKHKKRKWSKENLRPYIGSPLKPQKKTTLIFALCSCFFLTTSYFCFLFVHKGFPTKEQFCWQ